MHEIFLHGWNYKPSTIAVDISITQFRFGKFFLCCMLSLNCWDLLWHSFYKTASDSKWKTGVYSYCVTAWALTSTPINSSRHQILRRSLEAEMELEIWMRIAFSSSSSSSSSSLALYSCTACLLRRALFSGWLDASVVVVVVCPIL